MGQLTPQERAYYRALRRNAEAAVHVERARAVRDVAMSMVQASAVNPMWSSYAGMLLGAAFLAVVDEAQARQRPLPNLQLAGRSVMALAGADGLGNVAEGIVRAVRGAGQSQTIAFDIPDNEGPAVTPAEVVHSFRRAAAARR